MPKLRDGNESIRAQVLRTDPQNGKIHTANSAQLVKRAMREQRVGYSEMGRRLGITRQTVYARLNEKTNMTVETLVDMLLACGYSLYIAKDNSYSTEIWRVY